MENNGTGLPLATMTGDFRPNAEFVQQTAQTGGEDSEAIMTVGQKQIERMPL